MSRDARRVYALLRSCLLWLPGPSTWRSNPLSARMDSGEAPSAEIMCPACAGRGKRGKFPCPHCRGSGSVTVDAYTERPVATSEQEVERVHFVRCDSCAGDGVYRNGRRCLWCEGSGERLLASERLAVSSGGEERERGKWREQVRVCAGLTGLRFGQFAAWQAEKERLYRQGSYAELDSALKVLGRSSPTLERVVLRFVVYEEPVRLSPTVHTYVEEACESLARLMPHPIRVPPWAVQEWPAGRGRWANEWARGQRNAEIRRLRSEGTSLTAIGRSVGLSKQQVQNVLRRR